jgi:hypothetical protein
MFQVKKPANVMILLSTSGSMTDRTVIEITIGLLDKNVSLTIK